MTERRAGDRLSNGADVPRVSVTLRSRRYVLLLFLFLLFLVSLRFVFVPYQVRGDSMAPTLVGTGTERDVILVSRLAYLARAPERWDVVVVEPQIGAETCESVKRVAGLPGERLAIQNGGVWINGAQARLPAALEGAWIVSKGAYGHAPLTLREGEYFLLGDNSYLSRDSRQWGPVGRDCIAGKVLGIVAPSGRRGLFSSSR